MKKLLIAGLTALVIFASGGAYGQSLNVDQDSNNSLDVPFGGHNGATADEGLANLGLTAEAIEFLKDDGWSYDPITDTLTAPSFDTNASDGDRYIQAVNTVPITATPTAGRFSYYNGKWFGADGTDWDLYFLHSESPGSDFPTLNQDTTGTAGGLDAQYIDWSATSGGQSIANKPTAKIDRYHQAFHFDPDNQHTNYNGYLVLDGDTAAALTATRLYIALNEDPTNEIAWELRYKVAGVGFSSSTLMASGTSTAGVLTITSFTDATVPANNMIFLVVNSDPDETTIGAFGALTGTFD